jgi:hypothetical protein
MTSSYATESFELINKHSFLENRKRPNFILRLEMNIDISDFSYKHLVSGP